MPDVAFTATVTRTALGLPDLDINNHSPYYLAAAQFLGTNVTWNRTQISSPFVDGQITTQRSRPNVNEPIGVEIQADNAVELQAATNELITAFLQDSFVLTISVDGAQFSYACEAADYQSISWTTPRLATSQGQVLFSVPRKPLALTGGY